MSLDSCQSSRAEDALGQVLLFLRYPQLNHYPGSATQDDTVNVPTKQEKNSVLQMLAV
jgi:hypothetical protein